MDAAWDELVGGAAAPPAAVELCASARERAARELAARPAERLAALPAELDVVVEASGFLVLHFLGVASVLERAPLAVRRYAGASSGAMTPAELAVLGPERTLELYASYGALSDAHRAWSLPASAWRADRHWRRLAGALFPDGADGDAAARAERARAALDGVVHVSVTRLSLRGAHNFVYAGYATPTLAREAYVATGTGLARCDGWWCTDGGVTNGTPLFRDGARDQLVVRPTRLGEPMALAAGFGLEDARRLVRRGQDDMLAFLDGGLEAVRAPGIQTPAIELIRAPPLPT